MTEQSILVAGGYGVVGQRIAAELAPDYPVIVVVLFLRGYLREHWAVLRHAQIKEPPWACWLSSKGGA